MHNAIITALRFYMLPVCFVVTQDRLRNKGRLGLVALGTLVCGWLLLLALCAPGQAQDEPAGSQKPIQLFVISGRNVGLFDGGDVFFLNADGSREFIQNIYIDPDYYRKNYVEQNGKILRILANDRTFEPYREFYDGFEMGKHLRDLIVRDRATFSRCWDHFSLQSPLAPTVKDYNSLKKCILSGSCDFKDNRIDISTDRARSGSSSLRCFAVKPSAELITSKASIRSSLFDFRKGDDLWFEAWYFLEKAGGQFMTLVDFESTWLETYAGPRIVLFRGEYLGMELKFADKPVYQQSVVCFPRGQWVRLRTHLLLSENKDGLIEIWQDDVMVLHTRGRTLPTADTILTNLEIGISATKSEAVLHVDDVRISAKPIPSWVR